MRARIVAPWFGVLLPLAPAPAPLRAQAARAPASPSAPLVFEHVTVVDVERGRLLPDRRVVVSGRRIAAVDSAVGRPAAGARVIDGRGRYLIPGLWDMHVHVLSTGPRLSLLPLYVANGVTRVREMGGTMPLSAQRTVRRALEAGERLGPVVAASPGPVLTARGGPGGGRLVGGVRAGTALQRHVETPADARWAVDSLQAAGADFIKVTFPPRDAYLAVAAEARARGIPFVGHLPVGVSPREALDAGQRSIEHATGAVLCGDSAVAALRALRAADSVTRRTIDRLAGTCRPPDDSGTRELLAATARAGTWFDPTLSQVRFHEALLGDTARLADALRHTPDWLRRYWAEDPFVVGTTPEAARATLLVAPGRRAGVAALHRAGVPLLAGTDSPSFPYAAPGFSLHEELALLVEAGLTPLDALRAATLNPARFLHAADSLGTVAPGRLADLVLLDGDPLAAIANARRIRAVVLNGRYLDRARLDALLADAGRAGREATGSRPR